ncbi:MAG: nitroreductase family protein [Acidimicrobiia bacterium]
MELLRAMRTTPATRRFTDEPLPDIVLYRILEHARFAPNGGNRQAWHVIAVRDEGVKNKIADLWAVAWTEDHAFYQAGLVPFVASEAYERNPPGQASDQPVDLTEARKHPREDGPGMSPAVVRSAPVVLLVCVDLTRVTAMDSGLGRLSISGGGSVYPFCHNVLLAAREHGFGGCITSVLVRQEPAVKELLGIPDEFVLGATLVLGKPEKEITKLRRAPVESFATYDRFDGPAITEP